MHTDIACSARAHSLPITALCPGWQLAMRIQCGLPTTGGAEKLGCIWEFCIQELADIYRLVHSLVAAVKGRYL